jgi:hypothetical protein
MATRRIARTGAERGATAGTIGDTAVVSLTLPRRLAWGLGVYSRIRGVPLGELCRPHLEGIIKGRGLPWSEYDRLRAEQLAEGLGLAPSEDTANQAVEAGEKAEDTPPAPVETAVPASGVGGKGKRPLAEVLGRKKAS